MRSLFIYLKNYKKETILAPLFKMLEASFELLVPLVMAAIINTGIANKDKGYILSHCGLLILLGVIGLTCSITAQYFAAKAATGFSTALRKELFGHIQSLSYTEMDKIGTSTLMTRMTSDINQVQSGINLVLRLFLRSLFIVFGAMVMAFTVDVKAALVFVITIPLLSPTILFVLVTRVIGSLQVFDLIYMVIDKSNPALTKTQSLVYLFYKYAFINKNMGYGATIVVVLLIITMILTVFQMIGQKKWVFYN